MSGTRLAPGRRVGRTFPRRIGWRDYAQNVILQLPDYGVEERPRRVRRAALAQARPKADLRAWQQGRTGYPIVDAGMRQLWATGWMHNRVRMIAASFLIKHLLIDWREGEAWFWDCLVDADYGNNASIGSGSRGPGIDSNMFGRIMAPLGPVGEVRRRRLYPRMGARTCAMCPTRRSTIPTRRGCRPALIPPRSSATARPRTRAGGGAKGALNRLRRRSAGAWSAR